MKKTLLFLLAFAGVAQAQRYTSEVFTSVNVTAEVPYATNIDFLTSDLSDPASVVADVTEIKTALATGQPIPAKFYNPFDTSSDVKVRQLTMDIYEPAGDTATSRPLAIYIHTGNFPCDAELEPLSNFKSKASTFNFSLSDLETNLPIVPGSTSVSLQNSNMASM